MLTSRLQEIFTKNYKGLIESDENIANSSEKEIKHIMEKDHSKGNKLNTLSINRKISEIVASPFTYPDYSVLIHSQNVEK